MSAKRLPPEVALDHRDRTEFDADRLSESLAKRLLQRASELDAAGAAVTDLRAAATEAGISPQAFDAALAELRAAENARALDAHQPRAPRRRRRVIKVVLAVGVALSVLYALRRAPPTASDGAPAQEMVVSTITLRCMSPEDAAALIQPVLDLQTNTLVISPRTGSRALTVRATRTQLAELRRVLDEQDRAGLASCAVGAPQPER